ncbi:MAG: cell division protein ZipA C-terminal FtsZ-binding domain-containing protein, partial [Burkholderiales bacterium]
MPELRWILLAAGVALILGLWWWETRKAKARAEASDAWPRERAEPIVDSAPEPNEAEAPEPVMTYTPTIERVRVPRRPPLVEIPDDLEVDVSAYVARDRRRTPESVPVMGAGDLLPKVEAAADELRQNEVEEEQDDHHRAPWIRTHPLERSAPVPQAESEESAPPMSDPMESQTAEASKQRIVALRLIAHERRWQGQQLREALEAEGLHYGRFSIFHREREDGKSLFYVANMVEPGSFDLAKMDGQEFPGISLFGIVPGPLDAPATFDLVLTTGR